MIYTLTNAIGSKIFNLTTLNHIILNHITTGNFKIIFNKLWKSFPKDPKYRENKADDYEKAKESISTGIKSCIQSWCNKHGVTTSSFSEWKNIAMFQPKNNIITKTNWD